MKKELGKYFLDISKLTFAGIVLVSVMQLDYINNLLILISGLFIVILTAIIGFIF